MSLAQPLQPTGYAMAPQQSVVYVQQPPQQVQMVTVMSPQAVNRSNQWTYGYCDCCGDCGLCCTAMFFPSCAVASTRSGYEGSNCCFNCLCVTPCMVRNIVREGFGIEGNCCGDIFLSFCHICSITQVGREVKNPQREKPRSLPSGGGLRQWTNGFCSMDVGGRCLFAWCLPHCATAATRTDFDASNFCFTCMCASLPVMRNIIREGYGLEGNCCTDLFASALLPCCVAHQLQREVQLLGNVNAFRAQRFNAAPMQTQTVMITQQQPQQTVMYATAPQVVMMSGGGVQMVQQQQPQPYGQQVNYGDPQQAQYAQQAQYGQPPQQQQASYSPPAGEAISCQPYHAYPPPQQ